MSDITSISLRDRYVGTLLGLAYGDALGDHSSFSNAMRSRRDFPPASPSSSVVAGWSSIPGGYRRHSAGADCGGVANGKRFGPGPACRRADRLVSGRSQGHWQHDPDRSRGLGGGSGAARRWRGARGTRRPGFRGQWRGHALRSGRIAVSPGSRSSRSRLAGQRAGHARGSACVVNGRGQPGHRLSAQWRRDHRRTGRRGGGDCQQ